MIDYNDPASRALGCTAMHNVATIKGRNQSYKDKNKAVITKLVINNSDYTYISADISHSYSEFVRYDRRILFVRPDYFLIYDDIISDEEGIEWNLHSIGNFSINTGGFVINSEKAGMLTSVYSNGSLSFKISDFRRGCMLSYNPYEKKLIDEYRRTASDPMRVCSNLIISASDGRKDFKLAALLLPYSNVGSAPKPTVMSQEVPGGVVFTVSGIWGTDRLVCRTGDEAVLYEKEIMTDRMVIFRGTGKFLISDIED